MTKLFLDDERDPYKVTWVELPPGPWVIVRSYAEFVAHIKKHGVPAFVSFDHDLADEHYRKSMYNPDRHYSQYYTDGTFKEKTGRCCAQWLVERCLDTGEPIPPYTVHSMNPIGVENITAMMENGIRVQKEQS
jgi:hypothetical protein